MRIVDLSFRGQANARITPEDLEQAERQLNAQGHRLEPGGTVLLAVLGYDFAQEEKGSDYEHADEILGSGMRVHRTILRVLALIDEG